MIIFLRNKDFLSDKLTVDFEPLPDVRECGSMVPADHQFECVLRCGDGEGEEGVKQVRVTCVGKKDGQAMAAQAMLKVVCVCVSTS